MEGFNMDFDNPFGGVQSTCVSCGPLGFQTRRNFCGNHHEFCDFCFESVIKHLGCPRCREIRLELENSTCPNKTRGCDYVKRKDDKDQSHFNMHSEGCKLRVLKCECNNFGIDRCSFYGGVSEVEAHFRLEHPQMIDLVKNEAESVLPINLDQTHKALHVIPFNDEVFFYKHLLNITKKKFYVMVQMIAPRDHANRYFFDYKIKKADGEVTMIGMCHSDARPCEEICEMEKCIVMSLKKLTSYVVDGKLRFEIKIAK